MLKAPEPGLYRTTEPYPGREEEIPAGVLVFVGVKDENGTPFVVRPQVNKHNRWFFGEPTMVLRAVSWAETLRRLPSEGFYTLPRALEFDGGGRWLENALVQLGYNEQGQGILFVGEHHEEDEVNCLRFSERGRLADDKLIAQLRWAPILPIRPGTDG